MAFFLIQIQSQHKRTLKSRKRAFQSAETTVGSLYIVKNVFDQGTFAAACRWIHTDFLEK